MKIKHIIDLSINESEILVRTNENNKGDYTTINNLIKNTHDKISCLDIRGAIHQFPLNEIIYFESIDNKTKVICLSGEYYSKLNLKEIKFKYIEKDNIVMISRFMIVNVDYIIKASLLKNSQIALQLKHNNEVIVNRTYLKTFTSKLKNKKEGIKNEI